MRGFPAIMEVLEIPTNTIHFEKGFREGVETRADPNLKLEEGSPFAEIKQPLEAKIKLAELMNYARQITMKAKHEIYENLTAINVETKIHKIIENTLAEETISGKLHKLDFQSKAAAVKPEYKQFGYEKTS